MKKISLEQIKRIHSMLIAETGGLDGIRDEGLLESAINTPFQTFDKKPLYKSIEAKAARLGFSLINNHAFIDGNKRIGMMVMLFFLEINNISKECKDDEIIRVGLAVADGSMDFQSLLSWLIE
jgi:death on curing protein